MSVNLIELVKGQLGDSVVDQLGGMLGESAENTRSAVEASVPTILGGIVDRVNSDSNAGGMLSGALDNLDDGIADDFSSFLQPDKQASLQEKGSGLLNGLLGDNMGSVIDMVSKFSGIGGKSSSSLLGMIMPLVLGFINKQKSSAGLDQDGVMSLLSAQTDHISKAMPSGMADILGQSGIMSGLTSMLSGSTQNVVDSASNAVDSATSAMADAASSVGDAAGAAKDAAGNVVSGAADMAGDAANAVGDAAGAAKDAVGNAASGAADAAGQAASAGGSMIRKILPIAAIVLVVLFLLKQCT